MGARALPDDLRAISLTGAPLFLARAHIDRATASERSHISRRLLRIRYAGKAVLFRGAIVGIYSLQT